MTRMTTVFSFEENVAGGSGVCASDAMTLGTRYLPVLMAYDHGMIMPPTLLEFSSNHSQLRETRRHQTTVTTKQPRAAAARRRRGVGRMRTRASRPQGRTPSAST